MHSIGPRLRTHRIIWNHVTCIQATSIRGGFPSGTDGVNIWAYRGYEDRFPNEGGMLGASSPATLKQMLGPDQYYFRSFAWDHHDNLKNFQK